MLTEAAIKAAKPRAKPYKLTDQRGLCLLLLPSGARLWRLRVFRGGRETMFSLGSYPEIPLKLARERREETRRKLAQGIDPAVERRAEREARADTFRALAMEWLDQRREKLAPSSWDIRTAELWLLASNSDVVDYISTSQWPFKFAPPIPEAEQEQTYLDLISKGESETCEFKPYVDLANTKAAEIETSVCAFSNQRGGTILIGVSKEAEIDGITMELTRSPDKVEAATAEYVRKMKLRLQEGLKDNQCYTASVVRLRGTSIVAIEVEKTPEINFLLKSGMMNLAYVRHGATNMRMSPPEIRATSPRGSGFGQHSPLLLDS